MSFEIGDPLKQNEDLLNAEGIDVWSATQESLENQALNELNEFTKETSVKKHDVEDEVTESDPKSKEIAILENYIKKQEQLRKLQNERRTIGKKSKQIIPPENEYSCSLKRKPSDFKGIRNKKTKTTEDEVEMQKHPKKSVNDDSSCSEYVPSDEGTKIYLLKKSYKFLSL